jgi:putative ABC transport system permease protein
MPERANPSNSVWTAALRERLSGLSLAPARELEIVEELSLHLDERFRELRSQGLPDAEARRVALEDLREPDLLAKYMRPLRQSATPPPIVAGEPRQQCFGDLWRDRRYAARVLRRQPGFTIAATLTLALGIGANTAVFSVIQHVLLAPLPYTEPDRVGLIWSKWPGFDKTWASDAEVVDYQTRTTVFDGVAAWSVGQVNLNGDGEPARVGRAAVTANVFDVLGVAPLLGRTFSPEEVTPAGDLAVILSYGLWQGRYAGDPAIIGRTILLNGKATPVVGVMPDRFKLPTDFVQDAEEPTVLWTPYQLQKDNRGSHGLHAAGRLQAGVTMAQANAELLSLTSRLRDEGLYPKGFDFSAFIVSTTDEALASVRQALWLVFGAVSCLLLIACANVANLLLVRAESRARELSVRSALGANRLRLVRQLLGEGLWLALGAAVLGVSLAFAVVSFVASSGITGVPRVQDITIDGPVLLFSIGLTVLTLLIFNLAPALRAARVDLTDALKDGSQSATTGGHRLRLRHALVVAETAMAVILLVGALLLTRSLWQLQKIDLGFDPSNTLTMRLALPAASYDTPEKVVGFYDRLLSEARSTPGVKAAGLVRILPLASPIGDWGLLVDGYTPPPGVGSPADWQVASDGALAAMGERLIDGRDLLPSDTLGAQDVALVHEAMAKKYWEGRNPIGGRFKMGGPKASWITVVGVVGNVTHNGITTQIKPKFYRAVKQFSQSFAGGGAPSRNTTLVLRSTGDPMALAKPMRDRIRQIDAQLPVAAIRTLDNVVATSVSTPRLTGNVLVLFAGLALLLAGIGIYGVLSYVVNLRRQEIGIRLAVGAAPAQVRRDILLSGLRLTLIGIAGGLTLAALVTPFLTPLLHRVTPTDPLTFATVAGVLLVVATLASLVPAWRASRVDPLTALRS